MASTSKTAHLGLNQWVLTDPLLMEDMNADNRTIDTALQGLQGQIDNSTYAKLIDVTTTAAAQRIDVDVSHIDFTKFAKLDIFITNFVTSPLGPTQSELNNDIYKRREGSIKLNEKSAVIFDDDAPRSNPSSGGLLDFELPYNDEFNTGIRLEASNIVKKGARFSMMVRSRSLFAGAFWKYRTRCAWVQLDNNELPQSFNILPTQYYGTCNVKSGMRFVMYGVRL